jgi:hypothetical protein
MINYILIFATRLMVIISSILIFTTRLTAKSRRTCLPVGWLFLPSDR